MDQDQIVDRLDAKSWMTIHKYSSLCYLIPCWLSVTSIENPEAIGGQELK
jgi:hypothetical protein